MRCRAIALALLLATLVAPQRAQAGPDAGVAGLLSIVPGLGQISNGDTLEGLGWFSTVVGLYLIPGAFTRQAAWDLWQYNLYDAYRDAHPKIRRYSTQNVFANYLATFNPLNIIDPIGAPVVALGAVVGARNNYSGLRNPTAIPFYAFVGLGEEGLFRGFLFPGLSDVFSSKLVGAMTSSLIFAAVHITNGRSALGFFPMTQRFLMGMLFCWQTDRNRYDLRKSIFAHAWFDIFVAPSAPAGEISGAQLKYSFFF